MATIEAVVTVSLAGMKDPAGLIPALEACVAKYAFLIERDAKLLAPVDTGALRASIAATLDGLTAAIVVGVDYAVFMEEGYTTAGGTFVIRPFLRPAVEKHAPAFYAEVQAILDQYI